MSIYLPFRRAVKAHAESLGVCALLALIGAGASLASCASRALEPIPLGPPTGLAPSASAMPPPELVPTANAVALGLDGAAADASVGVGALRPDAGLGFEAPYPLAERPRAASPLQAAADDEELARWNLGGSSDPNYPSSQASFHPGTRVVVDAHFAGQRARKSSSSARGLNAERVQAVARSKGYWPFRLCFEAGQRDKKGAGGETRIRFTISVRGKVSAARLISSELHQAASSACLLSELRKLQFSPPPARHVEVVATIGIWPGDAELPPLADALPPAIDLSNGFDPVAVRARAATKQAQLSACFSEARRADPSLWGRLALAVVLEVDGSVHRVSEVESHFPNAVAARCAAAALSTVLFPSVNGKPFSFVLPLRLAPAQRDASPLVGSADAAHTTVPADGAAGGPAD